MTCQQVRTLIQDNGAVVLTTGRHTFDRYVSNRLYCSMPQTAAVPHDVPTRDGMCTLLRCGYPAFPHDRW